MCFYLYEKNSQPTNLLPSLIIQIFNREFLHFKSYNKLPQESNKIYKIRNDPIWTNTNQSLILDYQDSFSSVGQEK